MKKSILTFFVRFLVRFFLVQQKVKSFKKWLEIKFVQTKKFNTLSAQKVHYLRKSAKWWVKYRLCNDCFICKKYFFLNQFQNQDLMHKFLNNFWCVYIDTNKYNFEIEHVFVNHDWKKTTKKDFANSFYNVNSF